MKTEKNPDDLPASQNPNREQSAIKKESADKLVINPALNSFLTAIRWFRAGPTDPISKLEALKKRRFSPEGRAERIARSLAALDQVATIRLTSEEWRQVAEDSDIEDQF